MAAKDFFMKMAASKNKNGKKSIGPSEDVAKRFKKGKAKGKKKGLFSKKENDD